MSEHIALIEPEDEPAPPRAGSPRELAFRMGDPVEPAEPARSVALVPGRPRLAPWAVPAPGRAGRRPST